MELVFIKDNRYFRIGLSVFLTVAAILLFNGLLRSTDNMVGTIIGWVKFIIGVLIPFIIAFVLAYLFNPLADKLYELYKKFIKKKRRAYILALCTIYLVLIALIALFLVVLLPAIIRNISELISAIPGYYEQIQIWVTDTFKDTQLANIDFINEFMQTNSEETLGKLINLSGDVLSQAMNILSSTFTVISNIVFSIIISFYMLWEKQELMAFTRELTQAVFPKRGVRIVEFTRVADNVFSSYVYGRVLDSLIIGLLATVFTYMIGLPYWALFSFFIGLTNLIPYIGPIIGAVPPLIVSLLVSPTLAFWTLVVVAGLQTFDGLVLGPAIMSSALRVSPFWVLVGVIAGGGLMGFMGMFIGVPLVVFLKTLVDVYIINARGEYRLSKKQKEEQEQ